MKTLHYSIIVFAFIILILSNWTHVEGRIVPLTVMQLYKESDIILVGNVTSAEVTSSGIYTVYHVKVEQYLKGLQQNDTITAVGSGPNGGSGPPDPKFSVGDRVRLYLEKGDGMYMISMYSTNANPKCYAHELLGLGPRESIPRGEHVSNYSERNCGPPFTNLYPNTAFFLPPTIQFKLGVKPQDVVCNNDLQPVIKSEDGFPACVKSKSVKQLVEQGWTKSVSYGTLSIEDVKSITHFTVKAPSYLPSEYQFIGAQASPIDARLLYWNKTTTEHDFASTRQMAEGAIVISFLLTDEKSSPAEQTKNKTATMISLYNELIQYHREARLTHINGNLALVREGCGCLAESTAYSEKLETVTYVPLTTRIMYFDGNAEYVIESLLPSSILEQVAQSMK
ncbi:MAG: hypothetical protein E6L00_02810 [Thaumarchaeota archaeon]|nr:MAG: hypothetical protein E6L00_02810 [Nitrososphaerota archaeon]